MHRQNTNEFGVHDSPSMFDGLISSEMGINRAWNFVHSFKMISIDGERVSSQLNWSGWNFACQNPWSIVTPDNNRERNPEFFPLHLQATMGISSVKKAKGVLFVVPEQWWTLMWMSKHQWNFLAAHKPSLIFTSQWRGKFFANNFLLLSFFLIFASLSLK